MTEFAVTATLDARGLNCPMPVVKTSKEIKNISIGDILEVLATDPGSMADIHAWAKSTGNELLKSERGDGVFKFYIRRVK
ncbi:MAG: sulfurtransferase TusA family protein [Chloroflexi bacterium]|nr:sulfurtransferase TusA family protein [Chloroflexota bacterium]MBU1747635.1 sulfurtransferase TusA family protein [Chloroflexota bacterium]MBU1879326.1 sulfurtransferase TusA family protein [Chloroflexota bacterium]